MIYSGYEVVSGIVYYKNGQKLDSSDLTELQEIYDKATFEGTK